MKTVVRFTEVDSGAVLGDIVFDGDRLIPDDEGMQEVVDGFDGTPAEFVQNYNGWSNGYVQSAVVEPVKLAPVAERDAAMKEFLETTQYYDPETGEMYDPPVTPEDPTPDDDPEDGCSKRARHSSTPSQTPERGAGASHSPSAVGGRAADRRRPRNGPPA